MKVILRRDVKGLGREGEIKDVKDGYARNFLLPQKAAVVANTGAVKNWERHRDEREERERTDREAAAALAARLNETRLQIAVKAGEKSRLFGSVTNREVADLLGRQGIDVDRHDIHIRVPIKTLGDHKVDVHIGAGVDALVIVTVVPA